MRIIVSRRFRRCWKGCHCYSEFSVLYMRRGPQLRTMNCQVSLFPRPKAVIFLADAAAIKVRNALSQTRCILIFDIRFAGGDNFSCQVSQTCRNISRAAGFWKEHRGLRRGRMEEVSDYHRSSLLGGTYRLLKLSFS